MSIDPLQRLPVSQWHELREQFKKDWPRSISGYTVLDIVEEIIKSGNDYGFTVYTPGGDTQNGMIAINIKSNFVEYIIQCPKDDTKKLEEAIRHTNFIDWSKPFEVPFAPKHILKFMYGIAEEKNLKKTNLTTTETFLLNTNTPFDVKLPPGFSFENLSMDYVPLVDSVWPHRYSASQWYFELLTKAKLGYGLFDNNKQLLAWVYVKEMGALGHLYTLEEHRRKGYGELVLKLISNILLEKRKTVFAFCVSGNTKAQKMYLKLGFTSVQEVDWAGFETRNKPTIATAIK